MKTHIHYSLHPKAIELFPKTETLPPSSPFVALKLAHVHGASLAYRTAAYRHFLHVLQEKPAPVPAPAVEAFPGPQFSRKDLEGLSSGPIAPFFGEWFKPLDQYERLVRMPMPPLLLADRVLGIDATPGSMGLGTIWTETDVTEESWYLHHGRMPIGILVEAGQADLLLISWLGIDAYNQNERLYRLLGCDFTYFGPLPQVGDTVRFKISVTGHAKQGDIRIFFFQYDCFVNGKLCTQVRYGHAGFFTKEELDNSGGVLWSPEEMAIPESAPLDSPPCLTTHRSFSREQLVAFSQGNALECFGKGFESTQAHTRSPAIAGGKMLMLDAITHFDPQGGPKGRGYMRAVQTLHPDDWFFQGHFKNDPCMPGTLMFEFGSQLMMTYLSALGCTISRDGWRFELVPNEMAQLRCRGQAIPTSKEVVYEIFIVSFSNGIKPRLTAELLGSVDGLKSFHTRIGMELIPDWPLTQLPAPTEKPCASANGFRFDYPSLLACALGKPSDAFGEFYRAFDSHRKVARLPAPPYHFMTRLSKIDGEMGRFAEGQVIEAEYEVPSTAWYFQENGYPTIPLAVLMEIGLQPCGWLASFIGSAFEDDKDLFFRNLDGKGTLHLEAFPNAKLLTTKVRCKQVSKTGGIIIEGFHVEIFLDDHLFFDMDTTFGFFPKASFENQAGLPPPDSEKGALEEPSSFLIDLKTKPALYFDRSARLAAPMLLMIDRITGYWPEKKRLRAEKTVDPSEWFFKAHFFQDPVQPGSLGVEAMLQLLQFYMIHENMGEGMKQPRFEPIATEMPLIWKYRGQVTPGNKVVSVILDVTDTGKDQRGVFARSNASLWVDGKRIYETKNLGMRLVDSPP